MIRSFLDIAALQTLALQGWLLLLSVLVSGVCIGLGVLLLQFLQEAWQTRRAARRRQREITDGAVRYLEQRQLQQRIRTMLDDEQRQRLETAARTGRPS